MTAPGQRPRQHLRQPDALLGAVPAVDGLLPFAHRVRQLRCGLFCIVLGCFPYAHAKARLGCATTLQLPGRKSQTLVPTGCGPLVLA